jgi:hypothetical protein
VCHFNPSFEETKFTGLIAEGHYPGAGMPAERPQSSPATAGAITNNGAGIFFVTPNDPQHNLFELGSPAS